MGLLIFLQVLLDLAFIAIATLLLIERFKARTMEDPRLSRGLQLLSSKIAIIQDLMDRSETMGRQLTQIIDSKQQDVQERIEEMEIHLHKIQKATEKSEEVAQIFQERIPHQAVIERQNNLKYVQAAKMANQGFGVDEIARQFDIPRGELELIVKVNRDRITTTEAAPSKLDTVPTAAPPSAAAQRVQTSMASSSSEPMTMQPLAKLEIRPETTMPEKRHSFPIQQEVIVEPTPVAPKTLSKLFREGSQPQNIDTDVKPVVFKKIGSTDDMGFV